MLPRVALVLELAVYLLLAYLFANSPPPDVNESHYLGKAKHFWNQTWCTRDFFLTSPDAHHVFYWSFGWLSLWLDLPNLAWTGRFSAWLLLALSWLFLTSPCLKSPASRIGSFATFVSLQTYFHLAGEWVVGGVEAKSFAFPFVFLGVGFLMRDRWGTGWLSLGIATAFHPLVGGWVALLSLAFLLSKSIRNRLSWGSWTLAIFGFLIAASGTIPLLLLNRGTAAEALAEANQLYVIQRLPHHLLFSEFEPARMFSFGALLSMWLLVGCRSQSPNPVGRIHLMTWLSLALALIGIALDMSRRFTGLEPTSIGLLRFYWFRTADVFVPLSVSLQAWVTFTELTAGQGNLRRPQILGWIACSAAAVLLIAIGSERSGDGRPRADQQSLYRDIDEEGTREIYEDWVRTCNWVKGHTDRSAVFWTPRFQQTFRWYAERSEVANWKDIPQDAAGLVEWNRRCEIFFNENEEASRGLGLDLGPLVRTDESLRAIAKEYEIDYLIVPRYQAILRNDVTPRTRLKRVYPENDSTPGFFVVYKLR